jgi:hypothetical protein
MLRLLVIVFSVIHKPCHNDGFPAALELFSVWSLVPRRKLTPHGGHVVAVVITYRKPSVTLVRNIFWWSIEHCLSSSLHVMLPSLV